MRSFRSRVAAEMAFAFVMVGAGMAYGAALTDAVARLTAGFALVCAVVAMLVARRS